MLGVLLLLIVLFVEIVPSGDLARARDTQQRLRLAEELVRARYPSLNDDGDYAIVVQELGLERVARDSWENVFLLSTQSEQFSLYSTGANEIDDSQGLDDISADSNLPSQYYQPPFVPTEAWMLIVAVLLVVSGALLGRRRRITSP